MNTNRKPLIALTVTLAALVACGGAPQPSMKWVAPKDGSTVNAGKVSFEVATENWKFVDANQAAKPGEGHVHFFVNTPASSVAVGSVIPTDKPELYVHAGKAPYTSRDIELKPGDYTITAVMADSEHKALASPAPASLKVTVK